MIKHNQREKTVFYIAKTTLIHEHTLVAPEEEIARCALLASSNFAHRISGFSRKLPQSTIAVPPLMYRVIMLRSLLAVRWRPR